MNLRCLLSKFHRHHWVDSIWNGYSIAVEQRCRCGAVRHHLFADRNANGYAEPKWTAGPHPHPQTRMNTNQTNQLGAVTNALGNLVEPAVWICHWPNQDVPCCEKHRKQFIVLGDAIGLQLSFTAASTGECVNCRNQKS